MMSKWVSDWVSEVIIFIECYNISIYMYLHWLIFHEARSGNVQVYKSMITFGPRNIC